ncbi:MAG TPA: hypothetical protein V6D29_18000 [Leptolyngbyaceae cyanobacterium]
MAYLKTGAAVLLGTLALSSLIATATYAKQGNGHGNRPSTQTETTAPQTSTTSQNGRGNGQGNGRGNRPSNTTSSTPTTTPSTPTTSTTPSTPTSTPTTTPTQITLTPQQRQQLIDIIKGTGSNSSLISEQLRSEILANLSSLPPGIQQRLLRGRGLPPGIAKKFTLPASVLAAVNLPSNYQVFAIGSNVVVFDPATSSIVDVLTNVL